MWTAVFIICALFPIFLTVMNLYNLAAPKKRLANFTDISGMVLGPLLTFLLGTLIWQPVEWDEALHVFTGEMHFHTPVALRYLPTFFTLFFMGMAGYLILRFARKKLPPLAAVLCLAGVYAGGYLSVMWMWQILAAPRRPADVFVFYACLFPFNYLVCAASVLKELCRGEKPAASPEKPAGKNRVLAFCDRLLLSCRLWPLAALLALLPLLGAALGILLLFGQTPDAALKAFTETADWGLSQKQAPPSVYYDGHYLCTVAAAGHKKLVKPLRRGVRHGHEIMVNRQLQVANAFEELLQLRAPRFHRFVRHVYDSCGFPLAKLVRTPFAADAVYIMMKPLEWLFAALLYLLDEQPETRICRQYLGIPPKR